MNPNFYYDKSSVEYLKSRFNVISMSSCGFNSQRNLENGDLENRQYMGTYFVRTVAEHLRITEELFQNPLIKETVLKKKNLKIMDWCAGQGGASYGLIQYLSNAGFTGKVELNVFDGNEFALNSLKILFEDFQADHPEIELTVSTVKGEAILSWDQFFSPWNPSSFDFVITSKAIGEIIKNSEGNHLAMYSDFLLQVLPLLKSDGICLMTDVNVPNHGYWQGEMMLTQSAKAMKILQEHFGIVTFNDKLNGYSHHQVFETVFDGHVYNDKLCYSTFANRKFVNQIIEAWN